MAYCLSRSCLLFSGVGRKMAIFWGPFSGHQFWQEGVRPNCLASPLLAKNCGQKMATVLGTAFGRPYSEPRNRGRQVVTDCGPFFGLVLGVVFWSLVLCPSCGRRLVFNLSRVCVYGPAWSGYTHMYVIQSNASSYLHIYIHKYVYMY